MTKSQNIDMSARNKNFELIDLKKLLLDENNPRFGEDVTSSTQRDILNYIVRQFGVDDVLSSISVSGYFSAEPLVCRKRKNGDLVVIEGNRRLAAMLILANDDRAADHLQRHNSYHQLHLEHGSPTYNPVPAIIFTEGEDEKALLSYLGVRHIVSTKEWDSFAKAAWVAKALKESGLSLDDIAEMIGDNRNTIQKMMSGYHFIKHAELTGRFNPENSQRKGRGSNTRYPFSWVYTILGSPTVRNFLELSEDPHNPKPIPEKNLDRAELVIEAMFGDSSKGKAPAITDSRELKELAKVFSSPDKVAYLRDGRSVKDIERLTKPLDELIGGVLIDILEKLREVNGRLDEDKIPSDMAIELLKSTKKIKTQADKINNYMVQAASEE